MARFHGKRVSRRWKLVLQWFEADGVRFLITSGRRTMAEQWRLVREKGVWSPSNRTGAAIPSPFAPHIRVGLPNHALDVNTLDGGETRLQRRVEREGVDWKNTVPGEDWHGEVSLLGLRKLYRKAKLWAPLRRGQKNGRVITLKKLLYKKGLRNFTSRRSSNRYDPRFNGHTEAAVKRFQRREGLARDGVVGPKTWRKLRA